MEGDDERNVDEQLDEEQRRLEAERRPPRFENHTNNARTQPRPAGDPRSANDSLSGPISEATSSTTVTEAADGTEGTTLTGEEPRGKDAR